MKNIIQKGEKLDIIVGTDNSDSILYFLTNNEGGMISSKTLKLDEGNIVISSNDEEIVPVVFDHGSRERISNNCKYIVR